MDNKLDDLLLVVQALVDNNKKVTDELKKDSNELKNKLNKNDSYLEEIKTLLKQGIVQN